MQFFGRGIEVVIDILLSGSLYAALSSKVEITAKQCHLIVKVLSCQNISLLDKGPLTILLVALVDNIPIEPVGGAADSCLVVSVGTQEFSFDIVRISRRHLQGEEAFVFIICDVSQAPVGTLVADAVAATIDKTGLNP